MTLVRKEGQECGRAAEGPHRRWRDERIDLEEEGVRMPWSKNVSDTNLEKETTSGATDRNETQG